MEETVFTTAAIYDLLSQIDELSDYEITINEVGGAVTLSIGDSTYKISKPTEQVKIPEKALAEVSAINDGAYDDLGGEPLDNIESGLVKEALKTLLVGGAIRLVSKILKG